MSHLSSRDFNKLWKNYSNSNDFELFLKICSISLQDPKEAKACIQKKEFTFQLLTHSERLLKEFTLHIDLSDYLSKLTPILSLIQYILPSKELKFTIEVSKLEVFFEYFKKLSFIPTESLGILSEISYLILKTIESIIEKYKTSSEYIRKIFDFLFSLLETLVSNDFINLSLHSIPLSVDFQQNSQIIEENCTDILYFTLTLFYSTLETRQVFFNSQLIDPLAQKILSVVEPTPNLNSKLMIAKKFVILLRILKISSKTNELCINFVIAHKEKFKKMFVTSSLAFVNLEPRYSRSFFSDKNNLAALFLITYETFCEDSEQIDQFFQVQVIPLIIFNVIFASPLNASEDAKSTLKHYVLEFINQVYFENTEKNPEFNWQAREIQSLLLEKNFFLQKQSMTEPLYNQIWYNILKKNQPETISRSLINSIQNNLENEEYLNSLYALIHNFLKGPTKIVLEMVRIGLFREIFQILLNNPNSTNLILFRILSELLIHCNHHDLDFFDNFKFILQNFSKNFEKSKEFFENFIQKILKFKNEKYLFLFLDHCRYQTNPLIFDSLLTTILTVLLDKDFTNFVSEVRAEWKILDAACKLLPKTEADNEILVETWKKFSNSAEILLSDSPSLYYESGKFDFWPLVNLIRLTIYEQVRNEIILSTIDHYFSILIDASTSLIKFPEIVPVFFEFLCISYSDLSSQMKRNITEALGKTINLQIFSKFGLSNIFLYHLNKYGNIEAWKDHSQTFSKVLSTGLTIFQVQNFIKCLNQTDKHDCKVNLLKIFYDSLITTSENIKERNNYLYFTGEKSFSKDLKADLFNMKLENCIVAWIYPETSQECQIFSINGNPMSINVLIKNYYVIINSKEITLETKNQLKKETWNLLVINIIVKSVVKFLSYSKISVFINSELSNFREKKKVKIPKNNSINNIEIGGNFVGKLSSLYFLKKCLGNEIISEIYELPFQYDIGNFPQDMKNNYAKVLKDIKDSILINVINELTNNCKNVTPSPRVYMIQSTKIFDILKAYDFKRLLIELYSACTSKIILEKFYHIIELIIMRFQQEKIDYSEFLSFFMKILTSGNHYDLIWEVFQKLIEIYWEEKNQILILKNFMFNEKVLEISRGTVFFSDRILEEFRKAFPFSRENFYQYCLLIEYLPDEIINWNLKQYIVENMDHKYKDEIIMVISALIEKKSIKIARIVDDNFVKENQNLIVNVLLFIDATIQIKFSNFYEALDRFYESFVNLSEYFFDFLRSDFFLPFFTQNNVFEATEEISDSAKIEVFMNHSVYFKRIFEEILYNPWLKRYNDEINRFLFKQEYDYLNFYKNYQKISQVLNSPAPKNVKVRQVYDKFYRWPILKPLKSAETQVKPVIIKQKSINISFVSEFTDESESKYKSEHSEDSSVSISRESSNNFAIKNSQNLYISVFVERIKIEGSYFGKLNVNNNFLEFITEGQLKPKTDEFSTGALTFTQIPNKKIRHLWHPKDLLEVIPKRFIHKHTALEIILTSGKSYFLNFFKPEHKKEVLRYLKHWSVPIPKKMKKVDFLEPVTSDWKSGRISNFEYLMHLNKCSSRSNNDMSQYPIFPWVLSKYNISKIAYDDASIYRNFKYPIGAQSEEARSSVSLKYTQWKEEGIEAFHYGSHYSNGGIVCHYLLRIEPFTSQAKSLQGGSFDVADRLFLSIQGAWESCSSTSGDVKELVPEAFFQPFIFTSYSEQNFGTLQSGHSIVHTTPPEFAISHWDFLIKHRNALESNLVSKEIHNWIDLIFGFKQQKQALQSLNVFCAITYEKSFNEYLKTHEEELDGVTEQAYHFGQTPINLFEKKHPLREEVLNTYSLQKYFYFNEINDLEFKLIQKTEPRPGKIFYLFFLSNILYALKVLRQNVYLMKFKFKDLSEVPVFHSEFVLQHYKTILEGEKIIESEDFSQKSVTISVTSGAFGFFQEKFLISGLDSSNNLMIHTFKGVLYASLKFHTNLITSIACTSEYICSASLDSTIKSWKCTNFSNNLVTFTENHSYFGHSSSITSIKVLESYQLLVSASIQGLLLIHDLRNSECLHKINEFVACLEVNEHGIIGICNSSKIKYFGVNTDLICEYNIYNVVNSIKFSVLGDFVFEFYDKFVVIRDFLRDTENFEISFQGITDIGLHPHEKNIQVCVHSYNNNESAVWVFKVVSKKAIRDQQNIINELV